LFLPGAGKRIAISRDVLKTEEGFTKYVLLRDLYTVLEANKALSRRRCLLPSSSPRLHVVSIYITEMCGSETINIFHHIIMLLSCLSLKYGGPLNKDCYIKSILGEEYDAF
jgi:hypothetical protein